MDEEQRQHLEQLLRANQRRLRVLEKRAATSGLQVPADVEIEIEDLRAKIDRTVAELRTVGGLTAYSSDPDEQKKALFQRAAEELKAALKQGDFFQKYLAPVYARRKGAEATFGQFIQQRERRCYVIAGRAGKGKTSLLCHLAESLNNSSSSEERLPVLLRSADLDNHSLTEAILERLGPALTTQTHTPDFARLVEFLRAQNILLVVFIDAINELRGQDAVKAFNHDLNDILKITNANEYPILFCVSCRSEFWPKFSSEAWVRDHNAEFLGLDKPSHELGDFDEDQIDQIVKSYFEWYAIEGKLLSGARKSCCDPIMLRYLCEAYSNRKDKETPPDNIPINDFGEIRTLRRKEVFDRFVKARRESVLGAAKAALVQRRPDLDNPDERLIYHLTTHYLLLIVKKMYEQGRPYITADEAFTVARQLGHPDADLGQQHLPYDPSSIFFRFIDEDIILDKLDEDRYEFVFEAYFEYSLGRYIALERWLALRRQGAIDERAILTDFEELLKQHTQLVESKNFTNLFGALQFAILITEEHEAYHDHPALFIKLIRRMSTFAGGDFGWIQQACATIRETALAQAGAWRTLKEQPERLEAATSTFRQLLGVLDELTKSTDFVVSWDVENTLRALAAANFELTLDHMYRWAVEGQGLQPIFATQALARLSVLHPREIVDVLLELARLPRYRDDFWLARTLIFATLELAKRRHELHLSYKDWAAIQSMVHEFAGESASVFTRGVALPVLLHLSQGDETNLRRISSRLGRETWPWALWNVAFELQYWPRIWPDDWVWNTLDTLADHDSSHIRYAIDRTAQALEARDPARSATLRERLWGNRWRATATPGKFDIAKARLSGIVYSPAFLEPAYDNHVECRERIQAILQKLIAVGSEQFNWVNPRFATEHELRWAHNKDTDRHRNRTPWPTYVEDVRRASQLISQQTHAGDGGAGPSELRYESYETALLSAGGVLQAIDYVLDGPALAAWSLGRPPGHLANNAICIFNNIAIGAHYARRQYRKRRILIVDCDAHHGMHTNRVFLGDPDVIYFSMHIEGDYAREEGQVEHIGTGAGKGYTFNLPYPRFMSDEGYAYIVDQLLVPMARVFKPELIMISAGFDGHFDDPLTPSCVLSEHAYIHLARQLRALADELDVKIVGALEGGYGLEGLANSFAHMVSIIGRWPAPPEHIGFTALPEHHSEWFKEEEKVSSSVKALVRQRVRLMESVRKGNSSYPFDTDQPHWQAILADQV